MGQVVSFENHALANLRARVAAAEEANQDLIAFARGHSGAVASIHEAVLAAVETDGLDHGALRVKRFIEKPSWESAKTFFDSAITTGMLGSFCSNRRSCWDF